MGLDRFKLFYHFITVLQIVWSLVRRRVIGVSSGSILLSRIGIGKKMLIL